MNNNENAICDRLILKPDLMIPNALVTIKNNTFFKTIANTNNTEKTIKTPKIAVEPIDVESVYLHNKSSDQYLEQFRLVHLNEEEKYLIKCICLDYANNFVVENEPLAFTNDIKHSIDVKNSLPIYIKSYRFPQNHKEEAKTQIEKLLSHKNIQLSNSSWPSPG